LDNVAINEVSNSMSKPVLSIITVTKDCALTLEKTIHSVRNIESNEVEYIIIDGVSTDGTLELISKYETVVDTVISEPDTGIYNAMNKGVRYARGDYVLFMNGDDEILADGFEDVMSALKSSVAPIVCATTLVDEKDNPSEILVAEPWKLFFFNSIPHPSSFVRRTLLEKFPFREDLKIASDYDFFLQAFQAKTEFHIISKPTALHGRGGMSGDEEKSLAEIEKIRKERLGWRLPFLKMIHKSYRLLKSIRT